MAALLTAAHEAFESPAPAATLDSLIVPRMMHTLATVIEALGRETACGKAELREYGARGCTTASVLSGLSQAVPQRTRQWLAGLDLDLERAPDDWARRARELAFAQLARSIVFTSTCDRALPTSALRSDEIVWGRAPARLDLCGGWTDTPPYALEHGGCVLNAAVDLNGQPPIQAFARVTNEPVLRIASIDRGTRVEITSIDELFHYRDLISEFSLAKGALVLSGLVPPSEDLLRGRTLRETLEAFGGGIELTTLAAIPRGSGLGTSSILGAVLLAVLDQVMGRPFDAQGLFHRVLRLEQVLGTGGGWQDQIGGIADSVKVTTTVPGMTPRAVVEFVPAEMLDPGQNGGQTLLYYTGMTRVARNILEQVVGRYLNRDPDTLATLARLRALPAGGAAALARRDLAALGRVVDAAWQLNKRLDPDSTNPAIEAICERIRPHVHGVKLLGAGGGGFLLAICKSPASARRVRALLESDPPNPRARFLQ
jgi:galactokinase/mevalonate kinase-like predicted kinase